MDELLKFQKKIVPELVELLELRYNILKTIYYYQPIGRRMLSSILNLGERCIRNEIKFLKEAELISINNLGMFINPEGEEIIIKLKKFLYELNGLSELESDLRKYLHIKKVFVVPGDLDNDKTVLKDMGKVASDYLKTILRDDIVISITGGSSVREIADSMQKCSKYKNILILPARGGIGRNVDIQSNTIAANLAHKINANYKLLHVPDNLSYNALEAILKEKNIVDIVNKIRNSDVLIFGIGRAEEMAKRRGMPDELICEILSKGAVGEAFGHYFNDEGEIVYYTPTIGIKNQDTKNIAILIAIAGGKSKAKAIISTEIDRTESVLITDQGAAQEIVRIIKNKLDNNITE
ncbi:sugar-binding transcriptional regulator [Clostridium tepidiprofundi]|nr:sugar-binding domain-containing protein [Clostridium tepidiprofundi]